MFEDLFVKLYLANNVIDEQCNEKALYRYCPDWKQCWHDEQSIEQKKGGENEDKTWNKIQCPYVGEHYNQGRILFVGLNLLTYGGWHSIIDLFNGKYGVKDSLRSNKKRMTFNNAKYKGTLIFHRLAVYAYSILYPFSDSNPYELTNELADACEYIAFVEAVKCSPDDGNACTPIWEMPNRCPERYLMKEIEILQPAKIVFFDKKTFQLFLSLSGAKIISQEDKFISYYRILFEGRSIEAIYIVHPAYRKGGASRDIGPRLKKNFQSIQE
jgi:hypothetical protein